MPEPDPNTSGECDGITHPSNMGYEFQVKLVVTGHVKMRKFRIAADEKTENVFGDMSLICSTPTQTECETCG